MIYIDHNIINALFVLHAAWCVFYVVRNNNDGSKENFVIAHTICAIFYILAAIVTSILWITCHVTIV